MVKKVTKKAVKKAVRKVVTHKVKTTLVVGVEYWSDPTEVGDRSCSTFEVFSNLKKASKFIMACGKRYALTFLADLPTEELSLDHGRLTYTGDEPTDLPTGAVIIDKSKAYSEGF